MIFLFQQTTSTAAPSAREFNPNLIWQTLTDLGNGFLAQLPYIVMGIVVFAVFYGISKIVSRVIHAAGTRTALDVTLADLLGRLASLVVTIFGLFVAAVVIFPAFKPGDLIAGLGITSVAVGFAFKDVLQNFFAGILILWRRPFVVGDQLTFRQYSGTIEEINIRSTRIKTFDGERAVIPNGDIYTNAVLVKTAYDKRRVKFVVGIGYLDDIEKARRTIHGVLDKIEGILPDPGPWVYVDELAGSSVNMKVYFWVESNQANVLKVSDQVATKIKYALDEAGIDMPYPHNVVLFHDATGTRQDDIDQAKYLAAGRDKN